MTGALAGCLMVTVVGRTVAAAPEAGPNIEKIDVFTGGTETSGAGRQVPGGVAERHVCMRDL